MLARLQGILEDDLTGHKFDNKEYMTYFTLVYNMYVAANRSRRGSADRLVRCCRRCTQKPPHNYSEQLYQRYKKAISDYLSSAVLPAVREKTGQYMLKEVGKRWSYVASERERVAIYLQSTKTAGPHRHHKINVKWMKSFFSYLDRFHTKRVYLSLRRFSYDAAEVRFHYSATEFHTTCPPLLVLSGQNLPPMRDVGMQCFKDVIHDVVTNDVRTAVLDLIQQEREGETVDHGLLKSVVEVRVGCSLVLVEVWHNDCRYYRRSLWRWGWVTSRSTKVTLRLRCVPLPRLVIRRA
jgi:cullin 1